MILSFYCKYSIKIAKTDDKTRIKVMNLVLYENMEVDEPLTRMMPEFINFTFLNMSPANELCTDN